MEELGIIINQNGECMSFGKWKHRDLREDDNPNDWHDDSFMQSIYPTEWFQNLGLPYVLNGEAGFHNQLDMFAKCGIVVIVNNTEDDNSIVLVAPNTITDEQINTLLDKKEKLINFENNNISFIDVFDVEQDYVILESFNHISDYYDYLENVLEERKQQKK